MKSGLPDENETTLAHMTCTYTQNADSCDDKGGLQQLKVSTEDAGGGFYFVIETERWAIDSLEQLTEILTDFDNRLNK